MKIVAANILTAFSESTIGSKVIDQSGFLTTLVDEIAKHDSSKDRIVGQHYVQLPSGFNSMVSAGVGRRTNNPEDYVLRLYRGKVSTYLKRDKAVPVESVAAIVYTLEAYLSDPDVQKDEKESQRVKDNGATHILVAVLASAGPKAPLGISRFVSNLAGGNKEALTWTADEIRSKAVEIVKYWDEWEVVAD